MILEEEYVEKFKDLLMCCNNAKDNRQMLYVSSQVYE